MHKENPDRLTRAQRWGRFQAFASSQKQQATSHAPQAQGLRAKQLRRQRGRVTIVASILFLSVGILCPLLFARDALLAGLGVFLVSLLNLVVSILCLSGLLMFFVFFLFCRLFGRAYSNPLNVNARYAQRLRRRREELMWGPPRYPWVGHGTYDSR